MPTKDVKEEIIEGNRLIGFFKEGNTKEDLEWLESRNDFYFEDILCYHNNWSLLMPVVEKIGKMEDEKFLSQEILNQDLFKMTLFNDIETVFKAVVKVIEVMNYYNQTK